MAEEMSQNFLNVKYVKNDIIFMEDGSLRAVVATSGVNLGLKSEDERNAIISQFEQFLNTLDFSVQLVVQSRVLDIYGYLKKLEELEKIHTEELLIAHIREYRNFIKSFASEVNIMVKNFFIVIPYHGMSVSATKSSGLGKIFSFAKKSKNGENLSDEDDLARSNQLNQRVGLVLSGVKRMGVDTVYRLGTEELITMLYNVYNPGDKLITKTFTQV